MKFTLLLIPLLFISSCAIDWNDEKVKKLEELEKKIETLQVENLKLVDSIRSLTFS
jgi:outer membrane lipoprotein-sorting protein